MKTAAYHRVGGRIAGGDGVLDGGGCEQDRLVRIRIRPKKHVYGRAFAFAEYPGDGRRLRGKTIMNLPTYADIAREVKRIGGFVPKNCWIAHVKSEFSMTTRMAPNRIDARKRKHPCPPEKRPVIVEAMRRLGAI